MRRVLTFLAAAVLLAVSLGLGVFTADLPFWRRAFDLPLEANQTYLPTVSFAGSASSGARAPAGPPDAGELDHARLEEVAINARAAGADALLVMHRGQLRLERYFAADKENFDLYPADFLARPIAALAVGIAQREGRLGPLDTAISKWLPEWDGEPRGAITLRQLLNETSGLERGADAADVLVSHPFDNLSRLPKFVTSRGVRLVLGNDFEKTALGFGLEHEPGGFFNVSPANSQLAAIVVQRAVGLDYEKFVESRLFSRPSFGAVEMQLDRRSGMPAAHCCLRTTAHDALWVAELIRSGGPGLLPADWLDQVRKGSRANPEFGLQVERLTDLATEVWHLGSQRGGGGWIVPAAELSVLVLARRDVPTPVDILAPLLAPAAGSSSSRSTSK